jgi:hypothetical protein
VFENGLKDTIKDGLVHHEKPEDLHSLIELATRIDNRLWERAQQRSRTAPPIANTKRHRQQNKFDREGDIIMTDKVQEKAKDRKPRGGQNHDGLSREERQKRYENKACLRCGEVGHFRRDCPKNEAGKQGAVKIGMIRQGTPYPGPVPSLDDDVSDMKSYEEARLLDNETYEIIPPALEAREVVNHDDTKPVDWKVTGTEVIQRLANKQCWICGRKEHMAGDCEEKDSRIAITGPRAEEIAYQAIHEQPYFEDLEAEVDDTKGKDRHEDLCWIDCPACCWYHRGQWNLSRMQQDDCCHQLLPQNQCLVKDCEVHPLEEIKEYVKPRKQEPVPHKLVHWTFCFDDNCTIHYDAKANVGYFPKRRSGKRGQTKN